MHVCRLLRRNEKLGLDPLNLVIRLLHKEIIDRRQRLGSDSVVTEFARLKARAGLERVATHEHRAY